MANSVPILQQTYNQQPSDFKRIKGAVTEINEWNE